ncbi:MAG: ATP-binding protein, partial [Candidatus Dependentiae bacterium]|nr:ATP-binding protein [Candidatus Dependentiae bacterium]
MHRKKLPIGIHDFEKLVRGNYYFVDKSLLIKELLDAGAQVTLLPRPRRFGKTLNISMLRYFFEKSEVDHRDLFNDLKIAEHPDCMAKQGHYPVIFLTFRDVKQGDWRESLPTIKELIAAEFERHRAVLEGDTLGPVQRRNFLGVLEGTAESAIYRASLRILSACLHKYHGVPPVILIDEYDAPIHAAFEHRYYDDAIQFMRNFLCGGLKDNDHLEFGVLTGILRIAKESIFSGLNNLEVDTFVQRPYADKFGLLEDEVAALLAYFDFPEPISAVRDWYDGYRGGPWRLYNPWSIVNLAKYGTLQPYWINTSDNALLKAVLQHGPDELKTDLIRLLQGEAVTQEIDVSTVLTDLMTHVSAAWNLLLMSGYVTFENLRPDPTLEGSEIAELRIPNTEVRWVYQRQILSWFAGAQVKQQYRSMLESLVAGDRESFRELFEELVEQALSIFDVTGKNPEKFYHGLVLGMLASLQATHEVISNRESGLGRYDVSIFPKDVHQLGIIMEFKVVKKKRGE